MSTNRTLYLHVGCGKTGSSALQVWLHNQSAVLREQGIDYPTFGRGELDIYAITSGNGTRLVDAMRRGEAPALLRELAGCSDRNILLSSEGFQGVEDGDLAGLKSCATALGLRVVIIAYVRDVYDVVYSLYQQVIKRNLGTLPFREFVLGRKTVQQFDVVAKYRRHFDDLVVLHYDSERLGGLEVSLCKALGVDPQRVPSMPAVKVNRSLDVVESELLRVANQKYVEVFGVRRDGFSRQVSDTFIYADPERETEILLDDVVMAHLEKTCRCAIDELNRTYLQDTPLRMFDPQGKLTVREVPPVCATYGTAIEAMLRFFSSLRGALARPEPEAKALRGPARSRVADAGPPLQTDDPRLLAALRSEARRLERIDARRAEALRVAEKVLASGRAPEPDSSA